MSPAHEQDTGPSPPQRPLPPPPPLAQRPPPSFVPTRRSSKNSPAVWGLGLRASSAGGSGSIPGGQNKHPTSCTSKRGISCKWDPWPVAFSVGAMPLRPARAGAGTQAAEPVAWTGCPGHSQFLTVRNTGYKQLCAALGVDGRHGFSGVSAQEHEPRVVGSRLVEATACLPRQGSLPAAPRPRQHRAASPPSSSASQPACVVRVSLSECQ